MEKGFTKFLQRSVLFFLYALIFLLPLFFLPFTSETLELNKYFLFYAFIFLALLAWLGRSVIRKHFEINRTPLDIPLLALWAVTLLASIISKNRYLSFFGDFSFLSLNFLNLTAFIVFYFLLIQHIASIKQVLKMLYVFLASGVIASAYYLLRISKLFSLTSFGLPQFNTVHMSNALFGVFLVVLMIIGLSLLAIRKRRIGVDILALCALCAALAGVVTIGFDLVWVTLTVSLFFMIIFFVSYASEIRIVWNSVAFAILVAGILFILLGIPSFLTAKLPLEVSLGPSISWNMLRDTLTYNARYFLFGTGPSTFSYAFSQFRPSALNTNFAWNVRFHDPYSSAIEWGMSGGVLGILAYIFTVLMALGLAVSTWLKQMVLARRKRTAGVVDQYEDSPLIFWGITTAWLTLTVSFFFVNFGAVHWMLFWLFLGLMISSSAHVSKTELPQTVFSIKTTPQYSIITSFAFILVFTSIIVLGAYLGRFYTGEIVYAHALAMGTSGQAGADRIATLAQAIQFNPERVPFYLTISEAYLIKAQEVAAQTKDVNQVGQYVAAGVNAAKTASDKSPENVATWEFLATMYANARGIAPEANNWLMDSLEKAVALEPTNPTFYVGLGNAKLLERRYSEAKDDFEKAISLKPDLLQAYMLLAQTYEAENNIDKSIESMERGLQIGRNDATYVFQIGRYYYNRHKDNDWPLAELAWKRATALNPNYSDALFALGLLYERTNNKAEALPLYRRVLELNPGAAQVQDKINALSGASSSSK